MDWGEQTQVLNRSRVCHVDHKLDATIRSRPSRDSSRGRNASRRTIVQTADKQSAGGSRERHGCRMRWITRTSRHRETQALTISPQDFLWSIGSLCQVYRVPFDERLLAGEFPAPHSTLRLIEAGTQVGLKCALRSERAEDVAAWAMPCIAFLSDDVPGESAAQRPTLVLRADADRVLLFWPGESAAATLSREDFGKRFCGQVFFAAPAAEGSAPDEARHRHTAVRLPLVRARAAPAQADLARRAARLARHPADGARDAALHPGRHRQGHRPSHALARSPSSASRWRSSSSSPRR